MPTTFFMGAEHKIRAFIIEKDTGRHLKLKWRPDGQYLRVKDNGECLFRLRFDEIVHIQRCAEHLNMTAYPLIRGQRQKKTFLVQSDELNDLEKKIRESCAPQTPRNFESLPIQTLHLNFKHTDHLQKPSKREDISS